MSYKAAQISCVQGVCTSHTLNGMATQANLKTQPTVQYNYMVQTLRHGGHKSRNHLFKKTTFFYTAYYVEVKARKNELWNALVPCKRQPLHPQQPISNTILVLKPLLLESVSQFAYTMFLMFYLKGGP